VGCRPEAGGLLASCRAACASARHDSGSRRVGLEPARLELALAPWCCGESDAAGDSDVTSIAARSATVPVPAAAGPPRSLGGQLGCGQGLRHTITAAAGHRDCQKPLACWALPAGGSYDPDLT
jgi:hypothetical protein